VEPVCVLAEGPSEVNIADAAGRFKKKKIELHIFSLEKKLE